MSDIEKEVLIKRIAGMAATGANAVDIARSLKTTPQKVRYIMNLEECRQAITAILDEAVSDVVAKAKKQLSALMPKAIRAIERKLDEESDLKAAEMVLKGIGALTENKDQGQAQAITVVMPGGEQKEVINVPEE